MTLDPFEEGLADARAAMKRGEEPGDEALARAAQIIVASGVLNRDKQSAVLLEDASRRG
jgi:hypothetical protein